MRITTQFDVKLPQRSVLCAVGLAQSNEETFVIALSSSSVSAFTLASSLPQEQLHQTRQQQQQQQQQQEQPNNNSPLLLPHLKCVNKPDFSRTFRPVCLATMSQRPGTDSLQFGRHPWVIAGGSSTSSNNNNSNNSNSGGGPSPAIWCGPIGGEGDLIGAEINLVTAPSSGSHHPVVTNISFLDSTGQIVMSTAAGEVGILDLSTGRIDITFNSIPGISGSRPVAIAGGGGSSNGSCFYVATNSRAVAQIDSRMRLSSRPAQVWLWHPSDRISSFDTSSVSGHQPGRSEIIVGTENGSVVIFDARLSSFSSEGASSAAATTSIVAPWHSTPRPGVAVTGVARVPGDISGGVLLSWSDSAVGALDVVSNMTRGGGGGVGIGSASRNNSQFRVLCGPGGKVVPGGAAALSRDAEPSDNAFASRLGGVSVLDDELSVPGGVAAVRGGASVCDGVRSAAVTATRSGLINVIGAL